MKWFACFLLAGTAMAQNATSLLADAMSAMRQGDLTGSKALFEAVLAVEPGNAAARNHLRAIEQKEARAAVLRNRLAAIVVNRMDLKDVSAREAFDYLAQQAGSRGQPLNIVWAVPAEHPGRVSLTLERVPLSVALRYAAEAAGLEIVFEEFAVKVTVDSKAP